MAQTKSKKEQKLSNIRFRQKFLNFMGYDIKIVGGKNPNKSYALIKDGKEVYRYSFVSSFGNEISLVKQVYALKDLVRYVIEDENRKMKTYEDSAKLTNTIFDAKIEVFIEEGNDIQKGSFTTTAERIKDRVESVGATHLIHLEDDLYIRDWGLV